MLKARRFRPSMRSSWTLAVLTVVSLLMYLWANNSRVERISPSYEEKIEAAQWMDAAMDTLRNRRYPQADFLDDPRDPNVSTMVGQQFTPITTESGDLAGKWTALNPNMAAVIVEYLQSLELQAGDNVAVAVTGSLPGMNLAMYAAIEALDLEPIIVTSVSASSWGANDPYFTWLDMESELIDAGMLSKGSVAASIGGSDDVGRQLSPRGRELIQQAIERNNVQSLYNENLEVAVDQRMAIYDSLAGSDAIDLYVNVGGGAVSLGHSQNAYLIGEGINDPLPMVNYPRRGVIHAMNARGIPILNLVNVTRIAEEYGLPISPNPLPQPGAGPLFRESRYNMLITLAALIVVLATLIVVLLFDRRAQRLDRPGADPDTLL